MIETIREVLIRVEGFQQTDVVFLPATLKDFHASWQVEKMNDLIAVIKEIFFSTYGNSSVGIVLEKAESTMTHAFSTRNPSGGFSMGVGIQLHRDGKIPTIETAIPNKTYEGRNTLRHISRRLSILSKNQGRSLADLESSLPSLIVGIGKEIGSQ